MAAQSHFPVQRMPSVTAADGKAVTSSRAVAEYFRKQHKNVIQKIEEIRSQSPAGWYQLNFQPIQFDTDLGMGRSRKDPAYEMTRDGFTLLAMGFTGKDALAWKIAYIEAFNAMERELIDHSKPAKSAKELPNGLSFEQQQSIRALVKARVDALPKEHHAKAAITCWSALKSKYGVTYKEIDPKSYSEALAVVASVPLEGEWVGRDQQRHDVFEISRADAFNLHGLMWHMQQMLEFWDKVQPALLAVGSPLAVTYHDRFNEAWMFARAVRPLAERCKNVHDETCQRLGTVRH